MLHVWLIARSGADVSIVGEAAAEQPRVGKREGDVGDGHAQRHAALPLLARMPEPQQTHVGQRAHRRTHLRWCKRPERHLHI